MTGKKRRLSPKEGRRCKGFPGRQAIHEVQMVSMRGGSCVQSGVYLLAANFGKAGFAKPQLNVSRRSRSLAAHVRLSHGNAPSTRALQKS